jgi:hypothetical protein
VTLDKHDAWSCLRREWRAAADHYLRTLAEGWDEARVKDACRNVAGLSIRLRLFEQGRRSAQRATTAKKENK